MVNVDVFLSTPKTETNFEKDFNKEINQFSRNQIIFNMLRVLKQL